MARLENTSRLGFFAFPEDHLTHVARLFKPAGDTAYILDACAGEGDALKFMAEALDMKPFANEWQWARTQKCQEKFGKLNAQNGDFFDLDAPDGVFGLQWLNPPFDRMETYGDLRYDARAEFEFLKHAWKWLAPGAGWMVFVSYAHHLSEALCMNLVQNSSEIHVFTVPGLDLGEYGMVVTIARRRPSIVKELGPRQTESAQKMAAQAAAHTRVIRAVRNEKRDATEEELAQLFPDITQAAPGQFEIAPLRAGWDRKFWFMQKSMRSEYLVESFIASGIEHQDAFTKFVTPQEVQTSFNVVIRPNHNQILALLAAGLFNGLYIETVKGPALIRSVVRQVERQVIDAPPPDGDDSDDDEDADQYLGAEVTEDGTTRLRYRTAPETTITLLYANGDIENISSDEDVAAFISSNRDAMMDIIERIFESEYNFDFIDGLLTDILAEMRVPNKEGTEKYPLYDAQKHVVAAMFAKLRRDRAVTLVGEMGTGKTIMGASLLELLRHRQADDAHFNIFDSIPKRERIRPDQFNIVIAPPHLVSKWEREILGNTPNAVVGVLRSGEGEKPIVAVMDFIRRLDNAPADALKVLIMSREMGKVGEGWQPAVQMKTVRRGNSYEGYTHEKILTDPTTGYEILTGKEKPMPIARLERHKHFYGLPPSSRPRRGARHWPPPHRQDVLNKAEEEIEYNLRNGWTVNATDKRRRARARIREMRRDHDRLNPVHGALWQECRTFSALPEDPGVRLAKKLEAKVASRVLPLPDVAMKHMEPVEYHPHKSPRGPLSGVAGFLAQRYGDRIYTVIADECHEYAGSGGKLSAQAEALLTLSMAARKIVYLTGTLYKGVASSVYYLEFAVNPRVKHRYPWGKMQRWVSDMGVLEKVVRIKSDQDGKNTGRKSQSETVKEVPGASPLLLRELIDHVIFFNIHDLGKEMPEFAEEAVQVEMTGEMQSIYKGAEAILKEYLNERRINGDSSFMGAYFQALLSWPNWPYEPLEVWHRRRVQDPVTERYEIYPHLVHTIPGIGYDVITPKEKEVLALVRAELAEGRGVGLYFRQTGKSKDRPQKDILKRYYDLIVQEIVDANPVILRSNTVPTSKREEWLEKHADKNVLLCNANLVKTGLDLLRFPTLTWVEIDYSLPTMEQASHRSWRIGQDKDCVVNYVVYTGTMEEKGLVLMAEKQAATNFLYGRAGGKLSALTSADNGTLLKLLAANLDNEVETEGNPMFTGKRKSNRDADPVTTALQIIADNADAIAASLSDDEVEVELTVVQKYQEESEQLKAWRKSVEQEMVVITKIRYEPTRKVSERWYAMADTIDNLPMMIELWPEDFKTIQDAGYAVEPLHDEFEVEVPVMPRWSETRGWRIAQVIGAKIDAAEEKVSEVVDAVETAVAPPEANQPMLLEETPEEKSAEPKAVTCQLRDASERQKFWKDDVAKYGQPRVDAITGVAEFRVARGKCVRWVKLDGGEYVRESVVNGQAVYRLNFEAKAVA